MKKLFAEFFGTFWLVFSGTGAIIINEIGQGKVTHLGVSLVFGSVIALLVYSLGPISGAHFNPAVTIGFYFARRFSFRQIFPYLFSQCSAALLASFLLHLIFPGSADLGGTFPSKGVFSSFLLEILMTAVLMLVILSVSTGAKEKGIPAGLAIGGTVALAALIGGPISGASMNPARSLAPAIVSGHLEYWWIYLTAPLIGSFVAVQFCRATHEKDCCGYFFSPSPPLKKGD